MGRTITTPTGVILERPASSFVIERARLAPGAFSFHYHERQRGQEEQYDTRYARQYRYPYAWLAGWWASYYGWMPHVLPVPLHTQRPFHHPWIVSGELGDDQDASLQRKPLPGPAQAGCWWAVEFSTADQPTVEVPDLLQAPPRVVQVIPSLPHIDGSFDEWGQQVLALAPGLLAGLSNRTKPESIAAWAQAAAGWITSHAEDDHITMLDALLEFKWEVLLNGMSVPTRIVPTRPSTPKQEAFL